MTIKPPEKFWIHAQNHALGIVVDSGNIATPNVQRVKKKIAISKEMLILFFGFLNHIKNAFRDRVPLQLTNQCLSSAYRIVLSSQNAVLRTYRV